MCTVPDFFGKIMCCVKANISPYMDLFTLTCQSQEFRIRWVLVYTNLEIHAFLLACVSIRASIYHLSNPFLYWSEQVGDTDNWTVGVAAQSVSRRTQFEACPEAGLWCISLRDGEYRALTTPSQDLDLDHLPHLSRIRVRLDWDEGTLAFMNGDAETHLFTFRHRFTEKVYPYLESVSLSGRLAVLEQRVNVSVGSDYVSVDDTAIAEEDQLMKSESCTEGDINAASTNSKSKMSECGHLTEDEHSANCTMREEKTNPLRRSTKDQLIKTKPTDKKEKTKDNRPAVKTQSRKPRFSVTYHVSLNRALNVSNSDPGNHKQVQMNHVDHLVHYPCNE